MKVLRIVPDTVVDGPGLRTSVYFAGCSHHCPGCHNPESWDFDQGTEYSPKELIEKLESIGNKKVTFTGGDPLTQADKLDDISETLRELKSNGYNIWLYTGFIFEHLNPKYSSIYRYVDVLVDGPFIMSMKEGNLLYRGSSNQRLIDVQESLKQNKIIEYKE